MSSTPLRIGIETRQMTGHMTGIGNYSFHLLRALTAEPDLAFVGFGEFGWADVNQETLARLGAAQAKTSHEPSTRPTAQRYLGQLARRAARLAFARSAVRASQSFLFGRHAAIPVAGRTTNGKTRRLHGRGAAGMIARPVTAGP